jgi:hypothetical protein
MPPLLTVVLVAVAPGPRRRSMPELNDGAAQVKAGVELEDRAGIEDHAGVAAAALQLAAASRGDLIRESRISAPL